MLGHGCSHVMHSTKHAVQPALRHAHSSRHVTLYMFQQSCCEHCTCWSAPIGADSLRYKPAGRKRAKRSRHGGQMYLILGSVLLSFKSHSLATDLTKVQVGRKCGHCLGRARVITHGIVILQPLGTQKPLISQQRLQPKHTVLACTICHNASQQWSNWKCLSYLAC